MSEVKHTPEIVQKLSGFIATRDRRVAKASGHERAPLNEFFFRLISGQKVRVGGRSSCGGRVDPTWVEFTAWNEVVRKARGLGLQIEEAPIKHGNSWATKAGGFWYENDYWLATVKDSLTDRAAYAKATGEKQS